MNEEKCQELGRACQYLDKRNIRKGETCAYRGTFGQADSEDVNVNVRQSDHLIVLRDGRADHTPSHSYGSAKAWGRG